MGPIVSQACRRTTVEWLVRSMWKLTIEDEHSSGGGLGWEPFEKSLNGHTDLETVSTIERPHYYYSRIIAF